jgi:hypothetical protein
MQPRTLTGAARLRLAAVEQRLAENDSRLEALEAAVLEHRGAAAKAGWGIPEWCAATDLSKSTFYDLPADAAPRKSESARGPSLSNPPEIGCGGRSRPRPRPRPRPNEPAEEAQVNATPHWSLNMKENPSAAAASTSSEIPDPFDDLKSLEYRQDFDETVGVVKQLKTVPVRRPNPQDFFRTHPDPEYRRNLLFIHYKEDREYYLVHPKTRSRPIG